MENLKKVFNAILTVIQSEVFKLVLVGFSLTIAIVAVVWGALMFIIAQDLANVVIETQQYNQSLEKVKDYWNQEAIKYKQISEDLYEYVESLNTYENE